MPPLPLPPPLPPPLQPLQPQPPRSPGLLLPSALDDVARDFLSGAVLGAAISTAFYPLSVAKGVMQLDIGGAHRGLRETLRLVFRERGLAGLYSGVAGNAARSLVAWGVLNASKAWMDRAGSFSAGGASDGGRG